MQGACFDDHVLSPVDPFDIVSQSPQYNIDWAEGDGFSICEVKYCDPSGSLSRDQLLHKQSTYCTFTAIVLRSKFMKDQNELLWQETPPSSGVYQCYLATPWCNRHMVTVFPDHGVFLHSCGSARWPGGPFTTKSQPLIVLRKWIQEAPKYNDWGLPVEFLVSQNPANSCL
jgi:hypothetical protein